MSRGSARAQAGGGTLRSRIMLSMGAILVLVTLLAGYCLFTVIAQTPAGVSVPPPPSSAAKFGQAAAKIAQLALETRTIEQQFRKEQTPASVVQFEEVGKNLLAQSLELEKNAKQANDPKVAEAGAQIIQLFSQYSSSFKDLVQAWEVKGITADAGLRQKLNQAALHLSSPAAPPEKTRELEAALMQLGRAEQNYFAAPGTENQRLLVNTAKDLIFAAEKSGLAASDLQALQKSIRDYTAAFDRYQAVSLATSDPSLSADFAAEQVKQEKAMHKTILELEKMISAMGTSGSGSAVQTIRQQEQEYLTMGDAASAALVNTTLEEYGKTLDAAQITPAEKSALKKAAAEYQTAFAALVEQDRKITAHAAQLDKAYTSLQDRIKEISAATASPPPARRPTFPLATPLSLMIIAGGWLATVLITLLVARTLAGAITSPLLRMTDIAHRMAEQDDLSLTFPPEKNEFGSLAGALNALLLRQSAHARGGKTVPAELTARTEDLARLVRDGVTHDAQVVTAVAGQEEVLARLRTSVDHMNAAAGSLSREAGVVTELGMRIRDAETGCQQSVAAMLETVQAIFHSAGQIAQVIRTFTDLAEQTSVTALNAAIKSTRTGTQSTAFSAVTEDLDRLAKQANEAAKEIVHLVDDMHARAAAGDRLGTECRQALQQVATVISSEQQAIDSLSGSANALEKTAGDAGTLLIELDDMNRRTGSLVSALEQRNREVMDTLSFLDSLSGPPDSTTLPLEEEMKKVLHGFNNHEPDPGLPAGSSAPADRGSIT